jgi:hypothetical protein
MFGYIDICTNQLPVNYGGGCIWTCDDWAGKGTENYDNNYCDYNWTQYSHCSPNTDGLIRANCRQSCIACLGNVLLIQWNILINIELIITIIIIFCIKLFTFLYQFATLRELLEMEMVRKVHAMPV